MCPFSELISEFCVFRLSPQSPVHQCKVVSQLQNVAELCLRPFFNFELCLLPTAGKHCFRVVSFSFFFSELCRQFFRGWKRMCFAPRGYTFSAYLCIRSKLRGTYTVVVHTSSSSRSRTHKRAPSIGSPHVRAFNGFYQLV